MDIDIDLSAEFPDMTRFLIGVGWDSRSSDGSGFDLDLAVFLLGADGKVRDNRDIIFFNHPRTRDNSVELLGDSRDGAGDGDNETARVVLNKIPAEVQRIAMCVAMYDGVARRQNFGMVENAFIRLVEESARSEIVRFDLSEDASLFTAMIFGEIRRAGKDWHFHPVSHGFEGGLGDICDQYGVTVGEGR